MTGVAHYASAFDFRGLTLYWYGLAYMCSFMCLNWRSKSLLGLRYLWPSQEAPLLPQSVPLLVASLALGVVVGARIGSVIESIGSGLPPASAVTAGGMSSFGAFAGALLTLAAFCWLNQSPLRATLDLVAVSAPACILLIRLANLANGDFVGTPVESVLARKLLIGAQSHPVAIYEAFGEGLLPLLLLGFCVTRLKWLTRPGAVTGLFGLIYALVRGAMIHFREVNLGTDQGRQAIDVICCIILAFTASVIFSLAWVSSPSNKKLSRKRQVPSWQTSWIVQGLSSVIVTSLCLPLSGCGSSGNQGPSDPVSLVYSNPNGDAQCPCGNSRGAYAQNTSDVTRQVSWTAYPKDIITGNPVQSSPGSGTLGAGGKLFLGCTVYAPGTQCRYEATYLLNQAAVLQSNLKTAAVFGAVASPSISSCKASCENPTAASSLSCLPLGVRYYQAVAPLTQLVEAAQKAGKSVTKAEVMKRYNLQPSDDVCGRGDIKISAKEVINDGATEACTISSSDLPKQFLHALKLESIEAAKPLKMNTVLPRHVAAEPQPSIRALDASSVLVFRSMASAPHIAFEGAGGSKLTHDFGGAVMGSAEIKSSTGKSQMIIATENGCLSVDQP